MPDTSRGDETYEFGPFRLAADDRSLTRDGQRVPLPPKAGDILLLLVRNRGHLVTREELRKIWNGTHVEPAALNYQIYVVREALRTGIAEECIETVPQRGFRFLPPVETLPAGSMPAIEPQVLSPATSAPPRKRRFVSLWIAAGATVAFLALAIGLLSSSPPAVQVSPPRAVTADGTEKYIWPLLRNHSGLFYHVGGRGSFLVSPLGGQATPVFPIGGEYQLVDVHPTRAEYMTLKAGPGNDRELWVIAAGSEPPRRLGSILANIAVWSPDGNWIVYVSNGQLLIAASDGSGNRALPVPQGGYPRWPRWSPGAETIRFTWETPQERERPRSALWEVRSDGTGLRPVRSAEPGRYDCCGIWAGPEVYVFESSLNGQSDLWALTERTSLFGARASTLTQLTTGPMSFAGPVASSDGSQVFMLGKHSQAELVRFDLDSQEFSLHLTAISGTWLTFSPDRKSVTYIGYPDKKLWRARVDGRDKRQLVDSPFVMDGSAWSPDGKWIAFLSPLGGIEDRLWIVDADGGEPQPVPTAGGGARGIGTWSPDSKQLAFGEVPVKWGEPRGDETLWLYDLTTKAVSAVPGSRGQALWSPRWSPNNQYLAATTIVGNQLRLFDFTTKRWRSLPADFIETASWSSDSRFVYYHTNGSEFALKRVRISDGRVERLVDLSRFPVAAGSWSGLAPDDSPILLRSRGTTEIYSLTIEKR